MTYTEKELDQFLHGISLSLLSKKSAQHWRYDEETAKEIEWLEALERKVRADKADRKTENSSEKPNNCEVKNYCDDCLYTDTCDSKEFFYACTSKATISKMEQVEDEFKQFDREDLILLIECQKERIAELLAKDEPQLTPNYCGTCKHREVPCGDLPCDVCHGYSNYEPKDEPTISILEQVDKEPQTDCDKHCVQTEVGCESTDCAWK